MTLQFARDPQVTPATPPALTQPVIQPVAAQGGKDKGMPAPKAGYETFEFRNLREVPGLEVLTRLESQEALFERMRQELLRSGERIVFPEEPILSKTPYPGRAWLPLTKLAEPYFVCHERLYFEQQNFERGLWDFGVLTPVLEAGKFYFDIAALPYHCGTRPCQKYDCSAGKCLPGDPTPFYLYPVEVSLTGIVAEAGVVAAGFFIFP